MSNYLKIVTPTGVARFPHLNEPDEFKGKSNYKCGLILTEAEATELNNQVLAHFSSEVANAKKSKADIMLPVRMDSDKEGNEMWVLSSKTGKRPTVIDSSGTTPVSPDIVIGGGSKLKLSLGFGAHEIDDRAGKALWLSAYINAVQLIELVEGGGGSADFGAVEGGFTDTPVANGDFA